MEPTVDSRLAGSAGAQIGNPQIGNPPKSVASWSAIIAGAFVAIAVSLILLALGSGLGFGAVSPWQDHGVSLTTFAVASAIWLIVTQWLSAAVGGYIAGRLRTRWLGTNPHEIFFRDTAHGFVTWAVASVAVAALLASSAYTAVSGTAHAAGGLAASATQGLSTAAGSSPDAYGLDRLFRSADPGGTGAAQNGSDPKVEAQHILAQAARNGGTVSETDRGYLASLVAARTGAAPADAQKRVDEFINSARQAEVTAKAAADKARKAAAEASIYTALSMLIGAFIASVSAALGGRLRDEHP